MIYKNRRFYKFEEVNKKPEQRTQFWCFKDLTASEDYMASKISPCLDAGNFERIEIFYNKSTKSETLEPARLNYFRKI